MSSSRNSQIHAGGLSIVGITRSLPLLVLYSSTHCKNLGLLTLVGRMHRTQHKYRTGSGSARVARLAGNLITGNAAVTLHK